MSPASSPKYSPGQAGSVPPPLDKNDLESCRSIAEGAEGRIEWALETLVDHLDDQLVSASRGRLANGEGCRLAIFPYPSQSFFGFVVVSDKGDIAAGTTQNISKTIRNTAQLDDFDPFSDEVLTVAVTRSLRPVGDILDLFVLTRRSPSATQKESTVRAYHGLVAPLIGEIKLRSPSDDWASPSLGPWQPTSADRFPAPLKAWRFSFDQLLDPIQEPPSIDPKAMELLHQDKRSPGVDLAAWAEPHFAYALGGEVFLAIKSSEKTISLEAGRDVRFLSIINHPQSCDILGVAGSDTRRLITFRYCSSRSHEGKSDETKDPIELRSQLLPNFPVDVVFLPPYDAQEQGWPNLLASFQGGGLEEFSCVEEGALRQLWQSLWERFEYPRAEERLKAASSLLQEATGRPKLRRAILFGVVESVLQEVEELDVSLRSVWAKSLAQLFKSTEKQQVLAAGLHPLLQAFRRWRKDRKGLGPVTGEFATDVLSDIYTNHKYANLDMQARIDRVLRSIDWEAHGSNKYDQRIQTLKRGSQRNRTDIWKILEKVNPTTNLQDFIYRCGLGLERWSNTFLPSDTIHIDRLSSKPTITALAVVGISTSTRKTLPHIVIATKPKIQTHSLVTNLSKMELNLRSEWHPESASIRSLASVPGEDDRLLIVTETSGKLRLMRVETDDGKLTQIDTLDLSEYGIPGAMDCIRSNEKEALIAVGSVLNTRSHLILCSVRDGALRLLQSYSLELPRVSTLDIAKDSDKFVILAASSNGGPAILYSLAAKHSLSLVSRFRLSSGGVLSACFDSKSSPKYFAAGDRQGLLWCFRLKNAPDTPQTVRLAWLHQLPGAPPTLVPIRLTDDPTHTYFLAGSDEGKVSLLRSNDGHRLWAHRMPNPIQRILPIAEGKAIVVSMLGGWLTFFEQVVDRARILQELKVDLGKSSFPHSHSTDGAWRSPEADSARAIHLILSKENLTPTSIGAIFSSVRGRERRASILHFLALASPHPPSDELLDELTLRELQLLLIYLGERLPELNPRILRRIHRRQRQLIGDDSDNSAMAAVVAYLQKLGQRRLSLTALREATHEFLPYLNRRWARLELARVTLEAIQRQLTGRDHTAANLLASVLPMLFHLPLTMVAAFAEIVPHRTPAEETLEALYEIIQDLANERLPSLRKLELIEETLNQLQHSNPASAATRSISAFLIIESWIRAEFPDKPSGEDIKAWREMRVEAKEVVCDIIKLAVTCRDDNANAVLLVQGLRSSFPREPPLADTRSQEERARWLQEAREKLARPLAIHQSPERADWSLSIRGILLLIRRSFSRFLDLETSHLAQEVRAFPELLGEPEYLEGNRLRLRLRLHPEGQIYLQDVSLQTEVRSGLSSPNPESLRRHLTLDSYPTAGDRDVEFEGFLQTGSKALDLRIRIEASGYQHSLSWKIPLPIQKIHELPKETLDFVLGQALECILNTTSSVSLVVLDRSLGREELLLRWHESTGGEVIDLDRTFRDWGLNRKYGAEPLAAKQIIDFLTATSDEPVFAAPADELVERLLGKESPGQIETLLEWMRERATQQHAPLIFALSPTHAARLRGLGLGEITEVAGHRLLRGSGDSHVLSPSKFLASTIEEVVRIASVSSVKARQIVEGLGGDLALIVEWLRWQAKEVDRESLDLEYFLKRTAAQNRIRAELGGLPAWDLLFAIAGAEARTAVPAASVAAGMIAAESYLSTATRHAPKRLQTAGKPLTPRSLNALKADAKPPTQIWIQGLSEIRGSASQAPRSRLVEITRLRSLKNRLETYQRLAAAGVGTWAQGIFRTAEPYRSYLRRLYAVTFQEAKRPSDDQVYAAILGQERTPSDVLSFSDLIDMPEEQLKILLPTSQRSDRNRLKRVARFWQAEGNEGVISALERLYKPRPVFRIPQDEERWDYPLASLPWPLYGVGRRKEMSGKTYPVGFHFWVTSDSNVSLHSIGEAASSALEKYRNALTAHKRSAEEPQAAISPVRVVVTGPGVESLNPDPTRRVAILRSREYLQAAWDGDLAESLLRRARAQMRLMASSPFQLSGPLPPGSPIFFGREGELTYLKAHARRISTLILGSRRVGKTSLLNQVSHWARAQEDLAPIFIDLQGQTESSGFRRALKTGLREANILPKAAFASQEIEEVVEAVRSRGKLPIFLLNEIDGLAQENKLMGRLRALHDANKARFIMVAYSSISLLNNPESPFFHWTEGPHFNKRAFAPGALSVEAAQDLLGLLEGSSLASHWNSLEDRREGFRLLLDRSYRIPWVLQHFCHLLVERLEKERRLTLYADDVRFILRGGGAVLWNYIDSLDYASLGYETRKSARRPGYQLVLFALARERYFLGDSSAPILDSNLRLRSSLDFGFTVAEAREVVKKTVDELLIGKEKGAVARWFDRLELEEALRLLTLTLTIEPDPEDFNRFAFLMHLLPLELYRKYSRIDKTLDGLIVKTATNFLTLVRDSPDWRT